MAKGTRSTYEIASQIASVLWNASLHHGPRILLHPESKVALNMFGQVGFSVWTGELPEPRASVQLAPLPGTDRVREIFAVVTNPDLPADTAGEIVATLLPGALEELAIEVWAEFLLLKSKLPAR